MVLPDGAGVDDLNETTDAPVRPVPRIGRRGRVALGIAVVLLLFLVLLWLVRRPIAEHYIDRTLADARVPARYRIADLGLGRQRLTDVVIGDPARPDLVADWIETETAVGFSGARVVGVRAGHVRLRAAVVDGRVSLGVLDRLMPPPSGKPFTLPELDVRVADARIDLTVPGTHGFVMRVSGSGGLADGFAGRARFADARVGGGGGFGFGFGGCRIAGVSGDVRVRIERRRPHIAGPIAVPGVTCGDISLAATRARIDVTLAEALDRWSGDARFAAAGLSASSATRTGPIRAALTFDGSAKGTKGALRLAADDIRASGTKVISAALDGRYAIGAARAFDGRFQVADAALSDGMRRTVARYAVSGAGTPVGPLVARAATAVAAASRAISGGGVVTLRQGQDGAAIRLANLDLRARSGARLALAGEGVAFDPVTRAVGIAATATISGGGLPSGTIALAKRATAATMTGTARFAPYDAGGAHIALADTMFSATPGGNTRVRTRIELSGPLGDGRIDRLVVPVDALWNGRGRLAVNTDCTPVAVDRLRIAGFALDPARLTLCPTGSALVTLQSGRLGGGARLPAARLAGRLGTTPVTLAAAGAEVGLGTRGFVVKGLQTRLGAPERVTRLDFASVSGRLAGGGLAGRFAGGAGQIANVPLLLSDAAGDWTMRGGALALTATLGVSDAQVASPRFKPMVARDVALRLANGGIVATGVLHEPTTATKVADLRIEHALTSGTGHADLTVPGLTFAKGFQPDLLTPLTYGVIADVAGIVSGDGRIDWSPAGVTSTGTFRTPGTDLAAAFGPVTGIAGDIRFTDLLGLQSAPHQVATIKAINPGIVVEDGRITFQTLAGTQVRVEEGRWPFAGGTLTLEPTLLDFAEARERRMTFRVDGAATDQFLARFDFKNLTATGIFEGSLPMVFDAAGGRIENGRLTVRPGGGSLAYVGDLSDKNLGFWSNLAFGALKSLRYRNLAVVMNGPLAGEMVTEVKFAGISQGEGAKSNFLIRRLQKLPFVFNIRIRAPFRGLLDSAQSFYDPRRLIQRNLPSLIDAQKRGVATPSPTVQPPASGHMP